MEIWTVWHGTYRLAAIVKAVTAAVSLATAALLVPLVPRALTVPSHAQLEAANPLCGKLTLEQEVACEPEAVVIAFKNVSRVYFFGEYRSRKESKAAGPPRFLSLSGTTRPTRIVPRASASPAISCTRPLPRKE